jgi:hypothetical protein
MIPLIPGPDTGTDVYMMLYPDGSKKVRGGTEVYFLVEFDDAAGYARDPAGRLALFVP